MGEWVLNELMVMSVQRCFLFEGTPFPFDLDAEMLFPVSLMLV